MPRAWQRNNIPQFTLENNRLKRNERCDMMREQSKHIDPQRHDADGPPGPGLTRRQVKRTEGGPVPCPRRPHAVRGGPNRRRRVSEGGCSPSARSSAAKRLGDVWAPACHVLRPHQHEYHYRVCVWGGGGLMPGWKVCVTHIVCDNFVRNLCGVFKGLHGHT